MWVIIALLLLIALYLWLIMPARRPEADALKGWLYAHRGLHDGNEAIAENSMSAFRRAVDAGYGIELDVQLTADDRLVVFHDKSLARVCGVERDLYTMTYAELQQIPLPGGERIPLFEEVLGLMDGRAPMIVEVKYHHQVERIAAATLEALRGYHGAYCVESFHPLAVRYFRKNAPEIVRGQLAAGGKRDPRVVNAVEHFCMKHLLENVLSRPHFIAYSVPHDKGLSMWLMKHLFKPLLAAWTIRDQATLDRVQREYDYPIFELFTPKEENPDRTR